MVTQDEMRKWDREERYDAIFGHEGHVDTARMEHELALKAARECRLTGKNGVRHYYWHTLIQLNAAKHLLGDEVHGSLFTEEKRKEYYTRIYNTEMKFQAELDAAIRQGCPCAK